jgi:ribonuclease P protein component
MAAEGRVLLGFGKASRLLKQSEFNRVFKQGRRVSLPELTLAFRVRPSKDGEPFPPRLGLSVSRKVGKAVERNLFKRRVREIFRLHQGLMVSGSEMVVIPRKEAGIWGYQELQTRLLGLLERGKLIKKAA